MDVINRIRELMEQRGYSEYRLAKEAALHQSTVSNIFRRNTIPSIPTLSAICNALGITLSEFFSESEAHSLPAESRELLANWSRLTPSQRILLQGLIAELIHSS